MKSRGRSWPCGRTWTIIFLGSSQGRKIIGVLAPEMTMGRTAYFSVNSLNKLSSLQTLAIDTLIQVWLCYPSSLWFYLRLILSLFCVC